MVIVVSLRQTVSKQLIDTLGATRGCFGRGYEVSLLLQSVDQILKCSSVHLHPLQQDAVFQLPLWSLVQFSDELQALAMKRVLCHMPVRHKQHAMRLMRHELRGPFDGRRIDDRLSMVFADDIDQRELSSLLVNSAPQKHSSKFKTEHHHRKMWTRQLHLPATQGIHRRLAAASGNHHARIVIPVSQVFIDGSNSFLLIGAQREHG